MENTNQKFIELIKKRSEENNKAIKMLFDQSLIGNCLSILRQELDSFIRIIYLGRLSDFIDRERLMQQTLNDEKWTLLTSNNKWRQITDRDMIEKSTQIKGYIKYVYKFGCAFIHLSNFHNYKEENPFNKLNSFEKNDVKKYLNQYHSFPIENELTVENISNYVICIFDKISGNMSCYYDEILQNKMIEL